MATPRDQTALCSVTFMKALAEQAARLGYERYSIGWIDVRSFDYQGTNSTADQGVTIDGTCIELGGLLEQC